MNFLQCRGCVILFTAIIFLITGVCIAQTGRIFGAHAFQVDDGTKSGNTLTLDVTSPLPASYQLHFPNSSPLNPINYLASDADGNMIWTENTLSGLAVGNIWCGNYFGIAEAMPPGVEGSLLTIDGSLMPVWTLTIPSQITISASQITSGILQPGTTVTAGPGSKIEPAGGIIIANELNGAGPGKYSGVIPIPPAISSMNIADPSITDASVVLVSVSDPNASEFTVMVNVTIISAGIGFTVTFSAPYPNPAGSLHYMVINP